jgi:hypothetical protein
VGGRLIKSVDYAELSPYGTAVGKNRMRVASAAAAGYCAFLSMVAVGWMFLGKVVLGDWDTYRVMYDRGGGYLVNQGRDPLFSWLLDRVFDVFGGGSYDVFRIVLFAFFAFFAAVVASFGALEGSLILASVLASVDAFALKSLVQIREGIAFVFIVIPVILSSKKGGVGIIGLAIGCVTAVFIHAGTFVLLLVYIATLGLHFLPIRPSNDRFIARLFTSTAVAAGIVAAIAIGQNAQFFDHTFRQLGVTADGPVTVSAWKYLYWIATGVVAFIIRAQIVNAFQAFKDFRSMYAFILGTAAVPFLYVICVISVLTQFEVAAVVAMQIRIFLTALELSLVIIVVRGRANALTGLVAAATLSDQMRLILLP